LEVRSFTNAEEGDRVLDAEKLYACGSEAALLLDALQRFPDRIAIRSGESSLTYRDLQHEISRYCQALSSLGLRHGHRVGLLSGNRTEVLIVTWALNILGCCLVPMHPKGSLRDHSYFVRDAGLATLIFDAHGYAQRAQELAEAGIVHPISLGETPNAPDLNSLAKNFTPGALRPPLVKGNDMCRLSYSGGTTGEPKAIIGTYVSLLTKTMIQLTEWEWPSEIRQLICAPLSHAGGAMVLPTFIRGGSLIVLPGFSVAAVVEAIEKHRITCLLMVPTMIAALLDHPDLGRCDLGSLETIFYGASPISPARLREAVQKLGPIFFQFYGQTESPMTVCVMRKQEHHVDDLERLASCGRPVPWVSVALLNDEGTEVADGVPGEICVRGPLVMQGYWNKPEQTREAFRDDWLHTGDMAIRNSDGFLRIIDRKKDMIITGGFNVFAREVEESICEHPAVAACAVYGIPDARWGEAVTAAVVLKTGASVTVQELVDLVKQSKGSVQAPKTVEFIAEIPLTSLGKPDKKALRARAAARAEFRDRV
jgi:fatty-acyl-CoA synthase